MILRGEKVEGALDSEFMRKEHRTGMEAAMQRNGLLAAFRAAGPLSLEKLAFGAAAKPHSILAKTIKPEEVGLGGKPFGALSLKGVSYSEENWEEIARRFLCGLVGVRSGREVVGLYLSSKGRALQSGSVIPGDGKAQEMIRFPDLNSLLLWIKSLLISVKPADRYAFELAPRFIAGDYDIHEIQRKAGGKYRHIPAGSAEEAGILAELSEGALGSGGNPGRVERNKYIPGEYSPIQHGAQDNYLEFMFRQEPDEALVPRVLLPDANIAVYCGEKGEWSIIRNTPDSEIVREIRALYNQVDDMKKLYAEYGAALEAHWDLDKDEVQIALMEMYGLTPNEFITCLQDKADRLAELAAANPSDGKLREYIQFYESLIKKYSVLLNPSGKR